MPSELMKALHEPGDRQHRECRKTFVILVGGGGIRLGVNGLTHPGSRASASQLNNLTERCQHCLSR